MAAWESLLCYLFAEWPLTLCCVSRRSNLDLFPARGVTEPPVLMPAMVWWIPSVLLLLGSGSLKGPVWAIRQHIHQREDFPCWQVRLQRYMVWKWLKYLWYQVCLEMYVTWLRHVIAEIDESAWYPSHPLGKHFSLYISLGLPGAWGRGSSRSIMLSTNKTAFMKITLCKIFTTQMLDTGH